MECRSWIQSLVVLTLLQLCRAEIKDGQPQWYSANVINDGFQPKPITEIFSSEAPFSTANPIIVASRESSDDIRLLSTTLPPPTSLSSSPTFETSNMFTSSSSQLNQLSSLSTSQSPLPQYPSSLPPVQQFVPDTKQYQQINKPIGKFQQQPADFTNEPLQPLLKIISGLQAQPQRNVEIQDQSRSIESLPQDPPITARQLTTLYQPQTAETALPQQNIIQYELFSPNGQTIIGQEASTGLPPQTTGPPNYFLIYQQAPQSIQSYPNPSSSPRTTAREAFTTSVPPITSTLSSTFSSPSSTFSTSPLFPSTTPPQSTEFLSSPIPPRVTVTSLSTIGSSPSIRSSTGTPRTTNCMLPISTSPLPRLINDRPISLPIDQLFPLKIRVKAPSGSITNVNINRINPAAKPAMVTKKNIAFTTTRKPTTRRTQKPKKNTYQRCLQGCRKNGQPLCAAPLSQFQVDPKTLRGFPSVCHMACHNSYRKDAFEKVIDGSCSRLRTRIRPIDSDSKLKKEELQKVQYFVDNSGQQPVFEFTGVYS